MTESLIAFCSQIIHEYDASPMRETWDQPKHEISGTATHANFSRLKQTLGLVFNLRPGDGFPLFILLLHSFLKGAARVFRKPLSGEFRFSQPVRH